MPEVSLVVLGVEPPRHRIRITLRYDLPDPAEAGLVADVAAHAVAVLSKQRLTAAVVIGYGPEALVTPVARELRDAAWQAGIDLHESLRAEHGRYWSYACGDEECCPAAGVLFDVADPADAAALARIGPVLASRADLAARVAPLGGIAAESMREATRRAEQHVTRLLGKVRKSARLGAARHMIAAEGLAAVGAMISRYRDGGRFTSDDEIARITVALRDLRVRDRRLGPDGSRVRRGAPAAVDRRAPPRTARPRGRARRPARVRGLAVRGTGRWRTSRWTERWPTPPDTRWPRCSAR